MAEHTRASAGHPPDYDVAIVGGGISGIYSGWRLLTANPGEAKRPWWPAGTNAPRRVAVFEGSDRIGGRLLSARPPHFSDTTTCEIGGMRYVSSQVLVRSLVDELELSRYEQVVNDPDAIVYLRGKRLRFSQVQDTAALPYSLDWAEAQYVARNDPSGLIPWAIGKILPGVNQSHGADLHKYLREAQVDGTPLYEHGFWNLLARTLSPDAYAVARALIGYDCLGSNANAVDLIQEIYDFVPDVKYYLLNDGYETVPWLLEQRFEAAGGTVIRRSWLARFDSTTLGDGTTGVVLHFRGGGPPVTARALVLAMPRRSLELLQREGPILDPARAPHVPHLLNAVRPIPLYKLFLAYDYPWWNAVSTAATKPLKGRSLTDTPVRQLYYWPVDPRAASPPTTGRALLMAYNDATNVDFWEGLSGSPDGPPHVAGPEGLPAAVQHFSRIRPRVRMYEPRNRPRPETGGDGFAERLQRNWTTNRAPHEMVIEMHRQIAQMHDVPDAPLPVDAAYMDWSVDPYGGGVHFWNRGYKSWEVLEQMTQPVADFPCYICGEAYSTNQTWVEGALQTG